MKVLQNTPQLLRLRVVPYGAAVLIGTLVVLILLWGVATINAGELVGGLIIAGIGVILFLGCFSVFVKVLTVTMDRTTGVAEVIERGVFGRKRRTYQMADLTGATLQSMVIKRKPGEMVEAGRKGRSLKPEPRVWRVAFARRTSAPLPLTDAYGNEKTARAIGAAINGWFGRPDAD